jgi:RNA polymerase sigma-70 factor (ECF subfamily)
MTPFAARIAVEGRRAYPLVDLADDTIAAATASRDTDRELDGRAAAELYLAIGCAAGDDRALAELETSYLSEIRRVLERRSANPGHVDEVLQRLRATVLTRRGRCGDRPAEIAAFTATGPLIGWLRIAALRILLRYEKGERRRRDPTAIEAIVDHALPVMADPERLLFKHSSSEALRRALTDAWTALDPDDRLRLRVRYGDGHGIDRIAALEGVHRATAARRVVRAEERLVAGARAVLRERLRLSDGELDSVLGVLTSRLDITLTSLFAKSDGPSRG